MSRERFRKEEIKLGDRKEITGTLEEEETKKDFDMRPQAFKKLHNSTVNE
jgi:hypothetical protein